MSTRKVVTKHVDADPKTFVGKRDKLTIDNEFNLRIHDGVTPGGIIMGGNAAPITPISITTNITLNSLHSTVLIDATAGPVTVTLPSVANFNNRVFIIKKVDNQTQNIVTIQANGAETIDGQTSQQINSQWTSMTIHSNGTAWFIT